MQSISWSNERRLLSQAAVTNARFAPVHGSPVGPVSLTTTPVPPAQTPRSSRAGFLKCAAEASSFHLRPGGGVSLRLRTDELCSPPPPHFLARRPQTEAMFDLRRFGAPLHPCSVIHSAAEPLCFRRLHPNRSVLSLRQE